LGSGKGTYCPKWEVEASRCSIAGERAHSGARGHLMRSAIGKRAERVDSSCVARTSSESNLIRVARASDLSKLGRFYFLDF
jgi:hypothetical protein